MINAERKKEIDQHDRRWMIDLWAKTAIKPATPTLRKRQKILIITRDGIGTAQEQRQLTSDGTIDIYHLNCFSCTRRT